MDEICKPYLQRTRINLKTFYLLHDNYIIKHSSSLYIVKYERQNNMLITLSLCKSTKYGFQSLYIITKLNIHLVLNLVFFNSIYSYINEKSLLIAISYISYPWGVLLHLNRESHITPLSHHFYWQYIFQLL